MLRHFEVTFGITHPVVDVELSVLEPLRAAGALFQRVIDLLLRWDGPGIVPATTQVPEAARLVRALAGGHMRCKNETAPR